VNGIAACPGTRSSTPSRALALLVFGAACSREPCQPLTRFWGTPESWRLQEQAPRPRCAANDSSCGPEPALTLDGACYRPSAERLRLPPEARGERARQGSKYACAHDGECELAGCGNACVSYRARGIATTCRAYEWLDESALCGCVDGGCTFFNQ